MPDRAKRSSETAEERSVVWFVFEPDWSTLAVFPEEVQALRFALTQANSGRSVEVGYADWGEVVGPTIGIRQSGDEE